MASLDSINVSLEPHLLESLREIYPVLPKDLKDSFATYVALDTPKDNIPYTLLQQLSKWTRTPDFLSSAPGINASSYSMISLLAGTTTSPERKLGTYVPPLEPEDVEKLRKSERKAIATLVNAVLSVGGVGAAAWWASERTGWRDEWRALFTLFSAIVVACAEAGLYLIYIWRRDQEKAIQKEKSYSAAHKKVDSPAENDTATTPDVSPTKEYEDQSHNSLRQRK